MNEPTKQEKKKKSDQISSRIGIKSNNTVCLSSLCLMFKKCVKTTDIKNSVTSQSGLKQFHSNKIMQSYFDLNL